MANTPGLPEIVGHIEAEEFHTLTDQADRYVKTHENPSEDSHPAVYVVRDGRDALVSYAHFILNHNKQNDNRSSVTTHLLDLVENSSSFGSWGLHVANWARRKNTVIVRYEDLIKHPEHVARQALASVTQNDPGSQLINKPPSFGALHDLDPSFFRSGVAGSWRKHMGEDLHARFWSINSELMTELGYNYDGTVSAPNLASVIQLTGGEDHADQLSRSTPAPRADTHDSQVLAIDNEILRVKLSLAIEARSDAERSNVELRRHLEVANLHVDEIARLAFERERSLVELHDEAGRLRDALQSSHERAELIEAEANARANQLASAIAALESLEGERQALAEAARERLQLIGHLEAVAAERLALVEQLTEVHQEDLATITALRTSLGTPQEQVEGPRH